MQQAPRLRGANCLFWLCSAGGLVAGPPPLSFGAPRARAPAKKKTVLPCGTKRSSSFNMHVRAYMTLHGCKTQNSWERMLIGRPLLFALWYTIANNRSDYRYTYIVGFIVESNFRTCDAYFTNLNLLFTNFQFLDRLLVANLLTHQFWWKSLLTINKLKSVEKLECLCLFFATLNCNKFY